MALNHEELAETERAFQDSVARILQALVTKEADEDLIAGKHQDKVARARQMGITIDPKMAPKMLETVTSVASRTFPAEVATAKGLYAVLKANGVAVELPGKLKFYIK